jgi:hypothetical protein
MYVGMFLVYGRIGVAAQKPASAKIRPRVNVTEVGHPTLREQPRSDHMQLLSAETTQPSAGCIVQL